MNATPDAPPALFFRNARLIDPEAGTDTSGTLSVAGGRIAARDQAEPPAGATVIDCAGRCLAPGLVDWGVHLGEPGDDEISHGCSSQSLRENNSTWFRYKATNDIAESLAGE